MLVGAQLALPGAVAAGVGAGRPEIRAAAEERAVAQDQHAAVAALHAVEHVHVNGIKSVLHGLRISPATRGVEPGASTICALIASEPSLGIAATAYTVGDRFFSSGSRVLSRLGRAV
jgi:hypothetical protein